MIYVPRGTYRAVKAIKYLRIVNNRPAIPLKDHRGENGMGGIEDQRGGFIFINLKT